MRFKVVYKLSHPLLNPPVLFLFLAPQYLSTALLRNTVLQRELKDKDLASKLVLTDRNKLTDVCFCVTRKVFSLQGFPV